MKVDGLVLVDTNVLIHAYERASSVKSAPARDVLRRLWAERRAVLSVQNLSEFSSVVLTKLRPPMPIDDLLRLQQDFRRAFRIIAADEMDVEAALAGVRSHALSFWDALLWAAARRAGVVEILTEDFQHGRELEGVLFTNPYR